MCCSLEVSVKRTCQRRKRPRGVLLRPWHITLCQRVAFHRSNSAGACSPSLHMSVVQGKARDKSCGHPRAQCYPPWGALSFPASLAQAGRELRPERSHWACLAMNDGCPPVSAQSPFPFHVETSGVSGFPGGENR